MDEISEKLLHHVPANEKSLTHKANDKHGITNEWASQELR